jgi:hypothetical protein
MGPVLNANDYISHVLEREAVDCSEGSPVLEAHRALIPTLREWAGPCLLTSYPTGSFAKGTANKSGTHIDIFVSLTHELETDQDEIHDTLFHALTDANYAPQRKPSSVRLQIGEHDVDILPGIREVDMRSHHRIQIGKASRWTVTNSSRHVELVRDSGRTCEIRFMKLWRDQRGLTFPSFYLEMSVIEALANRPVDNPAANIREALEYLRDHFRYRRIFDPVNPNNIISDDLTQNQKNLVADAARATLNAKTWEEVVE